MSKHWSFWIYLGASGVKACKVEIHVRAKACKVTRYEGAMTRKTWRHVKRTKVRKARNLANSTFSQFESGAVKSKQRCFLCHKYLSSEFPTLPVSPGISLFWEIFPGLPAWVVNLFRYSLPANLVPMLWRRGWPYASLKTIFNVSSAFQRVFFNILIHSYHGILLYLIREFFHYLVFTTYSTNIISTWQLKGHVAMQQQNYNEKNIDNKVEETMSKKYTDSFKYRVSRKVLILCNPLKMRRISNVILKKSVMSPSGTVATLVNAQYQSL